MSFDIALDIAITSRSKCLLPVSRYGDSGRTSLRPYITGKGSDLALMPLMSSKAGDMHLEWFKT